MKRILFLLIAIGFIVWFYGYPILRLSGIPTDTAQITELTCQITGLFCVIGFFTGWVCGKSLLPHLSSYPLPHRWVSKLPDWGVSGLGAALGLILAELCLGFEYRSLLWPPIAMSAVMAAIGDLAGSSN